MAPSPTRRVKLVKLFRIKGTWFLLLIEEQLMDNFDIKVYIS